SVHARSDPIALVRTMRRSVRLEPRRANCGLGVFDALRRNEKIHIGEPPHPRLIEVHARRVKTLECDDRDIARAQRIQRRCDLTANPCRSAPAVIDVSREDGRYIVAGDDAAVLRPPSDDWPHARRMTSDAKGVRAETIVDGHAAAAGEHLSRYTLQLARSGDS